jgi:hypothetical protein
MNQRNLGCFRVLHVEAGIPLNGSELDVAIGSCCRTCCRTSVVDTVMHPAESCSTVHVQNRARVLECLRPWSRNRPMGPLKALESPTENLRALAFS